MVMTPLPKKTRIVVHMTSLPEYKKARARQEEYKRKREDAKFIRHVCGTAPKFNFFASGGNHVD